MKEETDHLIEAKHHIEGYVESHLQLATLEVAERSAGLIGAAAVSLSTVVLGLLTLCFISFAAAFYLGDVLNGIHWGFLCVGGFYLLIMLIYILFGKPYLQRLYANGIIKIMFKDHD